MKHFIQENITRALPTDIICCPSDGHYC